MSADKILVLNEVAEILRMSVKTARRRISNKEIPAFKEGGRVCVLMSELDKYLQRKIQSTATA